MKQNEPRLIQLPWPPTINHYYIKGRTLTNAGKRYRDEVCYTVRRGEPMTGPLGVTIITRPPNHIKRDLDNLLKAPLDALTHTGHVWWDDSQIKLLAITEGAVWKPGCLWIQVEPLRETLSSLSSGSPQSEIFRTFQPELISAHWSEHPE